jgi:hypothetical protein
MFVLMRSLLKGLTLTPNPNHNFIRNCDDEEIADEISPEGPCEHVTEEDGQLVFQRYLFKHTYLFICICASTYIYV